MGKWLSEKMLLVKTMLAALMGRIRPEQLFDMTDEQLRIVANGSPTLRISALWLLAERRDR